MCTQLQANWHRASIARNLLGTFKGANSASRNLRSIETSSHKTIQVIRLFMGGSLEFLPNAEHHFRYDL